MAVCKLCLQDKQLIKKSHIIPEFMYQDLFDANHKMYMFKPHEKVRGEGYVSRPSSGEYEGELLCADCDNKLIGSYEDYASKAMYGGALPTNECPIVENYKNQHGVGFTKCTNISYKSYKLFLLSILWRAHISSRPMFREIQLGPHAELIRQLILSGDPGEVDTYPIFMMTYINDKSMPKDLVAHPQKRRTKDGHITYTFMIGGVVYIFYVNNSGHKLPDHIISETINPKNEMNIIHIPEGMGWDLILGFYGLIDKPSH